MGLSGPGVLNGDLLKKMGDKPIILAMSNPIPEIMPEDAMAARPDAILATGRSDYPNQVNNVLCFPFIFRGALDCGASTINEEMKMAAVRAIADLATMETSDVVAAAYADEALKFGPEYLIPKAFDPRLIEVVPMAVVKAAMESGVATRPIEDLEAYRQTLNEFVNQAGLFMQPIIEMAKKAPARIVYAEGENDDVLLAVQAVLDEQIAMPIRYGAKD
jgi:malate dehydrogenase (oxaloacetate-decarboxylating)(NADP+)